MEKSRLIDICKYYKGEKENPHNYSKEYSILTELKCHFWDYEEMFVKNSTNATTEDEFKDYINGCINKCTPNEYDPYTAYFDGVLRKKSEV